MDFQDFKKYIVWGVIMTYDFAGLFLLTATFFHPEQKPTADFLIWFTPWLIAFIFTLIYFVSWLCKRKKKGKRASTKKTLTELEKVKKEFDSGFTSINKRLDNIERALNISVAKQDRREKGGRRTKLG